MDKTTLGSRMKAAEHVYRNYLPTKQYYVLRLDGRSFSKYTKGMEAFNRGMIEDMQQTMLAVCKEVQGAQFGYTQSDEISVIFTDLQSTDSDIWFGGSVQKIVSVAASIATATFNRLRAARNLRTFVAELNDTGVDVDRLPNAMIAHVATTRIAQFDARVFSMSQRQEALNAVLWRQQDASKNSVQMLARSLFSHKECQNKNGSELQDMMMLEKGMNWNDIGTVKKRGTACYRKMEIVQSDIIKGDDVRFPWFIDEEAPIFSNDWGWFDGKVL